MLARFTTTPHPMYADFGRGRRCVISKFDSSLDRYRLVDRRTVRVLLGGICDDTLRKRIEGDVFLKPIVGENGRHTWRLGSVLDWIDERERKVSAAAEAA